MSGGSKILASSKNTTITRAVQLVSLLGMERGFSPEYQARPG